MSGHLAKPDPGSGRRTRTSPRPRQLASSPSPPGQRPHGSHGRRAGDGSRPTRSRRRPTRWPTWRTVRPARVTAAAIPTGAGCSTGNGRISSASGKVVASSIGSGATAGGGRTRGWMDWPAWMTQASPGWAWRTASGSILGRSPMRALASPRGPQKSSSQLCSRVRTIPARANQPLRVRALVHHDPAGAAGQQPGCRGGGRGWPRLTREQARQSA
jgi:hypothetical protein